MWKCKLKIASATSAANRPSSNALSALRTFIYTLHIQGLPVFENRNVNPEFVFTL